MHRPRRHRGASYRRAAREKKRKKTAFKENKGALVSKIAELKRVRQMLRDDWGIDPQDVVAERAQSEAHQAKTRRTGHNIPQAGLEEEVDVLPRSSFLLLVSTFSRPEIQAAVD